MEEPITIVRVELLPGPNGCYKSDWCIGSPHESMGCYDGTGYSFLADDDAKERDRMLAELSTAGMLMSVRVFLVAHGQYSLPQDEARFVRDKRAYRRRLAALERITRAWQYWAGLPR